MKVQRRSVRLYAFLAVICVLFLFSVVTVADTCCECRPCSPQGWAKLEAEKEIYRGGEEVNFTFFNPTGYRFQIKELYILRQPFRYILDDVVYVHQFEEAVFPGKLWRWKWDQGEDWTKLAAPGRYLLVMETRCCGTFKTDFVIACIPLAPSEKMGEPEKALKEGKEAASPSEAEEQPEEAEKTTGETLKAKEEKTAGGIIAEERGILCIIAGLIAVAAAIYI